MKIFVILIFLLFASKSLFSQDQDFVFKEDPTHEINGNNFNLYGFLNHVRLDSINSKYATLESGSWSYEFEFGQVRNRKTENFFRDSAGIRIKFNSFITVLNFMEFNKWRFKTSIETKAIYQGVLLLFEKSPSSP